MPMVTDAVRELDGVVARIVSSGLVIHPPYTLVEVASLVRALASHLPVRRAFLFGSYARGDQTPASDLDVALEPLFPGALGFGEIEAFRSAVRTVLGLDCDVITSLVGAGETFYESFQRDARLVYDSKRTRRIEGRADSAAL